MVSSFGIKFLLLLSILIPLKYVSRSCWKKKRILQEVITHTKFRKFLLQLICCCTILHFAPLHWYEMNHLWIVYQKMKHINLLGFLAPICHHTCICKLMFVTKVLSCILIAYFECCLKLHWCTFCMIWQINVLNINTNTMAPIFMAGCS